MDSLRTISTRIDKQIEDLRIVTYFHRQMLAIVLRFRMRDGIKTFRAQVQIGLGQSYSHWDNGISSDSVRALPGAMNLTCPLLM